jgi:hypothetical protein
LSLKAFSLQSVFLSICLHLSKNLPPGEILQLLAYLPHLSSAEVISERVMALGATLSARKFFLCGRGLQPRSSSASGGESRSHRKNINFLGRKSLRVAVLFIIF